MNSRFTHAAGFALISVLATTVLALIIYLIADPMSPLNYLSYVVVVTIACLGVKKWREQNSGYLTFGQTYIHLLFQAIVYSLMSGVWAFVFFTYIAPDAIVSMQLKQEVMWEEQGLSQSQINMMADMMREWQTPPIMAVGAWIGNTIILGIIYLVVAALMKKDPPPGVWTPPADGSFPNTSPTNIPSQQ